MNKLRMSPVPEQSEQATAYAAVRVMVFYFFNLKFKL